MQTMDMSLSNLARQGKVSLQTAMDAAHDPEELKRLAGGAAVTADGSRGGAMAMGSVMGGGSLG
jgi:hypothetical protein